MTGPQGGAWMGHPPHGHPTPPPQPPQAEDTGLQTRPMGLKVQYTFEKDQQNCLARWPHTLQIQTIPIDDRNAIGIIDLRTCLQALAQCSPEIINQPDKDYAVYAVDYSEEDVPMVGQGMLSWGLEQPSLCSEPKLVTGRVTKNMLAALRGGVPETLEVRLKLNAVPRMQRPQTSQNSEMRGYGSNAPTPTPTDGNSEWSSLMQSNSNFGWPTNGPSAPSPGFPPPRYGSPIQAPSPAPDARPDMYAPHPGAPTPPTTAVALAPALAPAPAKPTPASFFPPVPSSQAPTPDDAPAPPKADGPARSKKAKRASSKAPKKRTTTSTGNPRGRPPKRRPDAGNTSAIEDATDAEEAPTEGRQIKRAKTFKADWPSKAPLNSAPGSLRVAASTSGSLRTMRPAASGGNGVAGTHLQDIPRAPTPVPGQLPRPQSMPAGPGQLRRTSMTGFEGSSRFLVSERGIPGPSTLDARSPPEFASQSPSQVYTPEGESPGDLGSSPPVPRSTNSIRSSPPRSSPVLPPMPLPQPQPDSGFMSGGFDEMVDEEDVQLPVPIPVTMPQPIAPGRPKPPTKSKSGNPKRPVPKLSNGPPCPSSRGLPQPPVTAPLRPMSRDTSVPAFEMPTDVTADTSVPTKQKEMVIQREYPGPQELLPKKSIYNPAGSARAQSAKAQVKNSRATGTTKGAARPLKRSNTEPNLQRQEMPVLPTDPPPMSQQPVKAEPAEPDVQQVEHVNQPTSESPNTPAVQQLEPLEELRMKTMNEPEVRQPGDQPTVESPNGAVEGAQAPTPAAPETMQDTDDHLLRLLSEPMEIAQDIDHELPQMAALRPDSELPQPPNSEAAGPGFMLPIPASDPGTRAAVGSPSDCSLEEAVQQSKNMSRKQSIKKKLEKAVKNGEMPTFCSNCGSISTPTWRKIWTQDSDGSPDIPEYSDKPGCITAIVILQRDENGKPTKYRTVKKALGTAESSKEWTEAILCNPCGLWLSKYQTQRPESKWESDFSKIGRSRKKRTEKSSRSKKGKGQDMAHSNLTSEAYFTTDPIGPDDQGPSPATEGDEVMLLRGPTTEPPSRERGARSQTTGPEASFDCPDRQGSTHSRGSGTAQSPIALEEDDLGKTRRLLFPSPKKDGQPKVLGEVAVNIVRTTSGIGTSKIAGKENAMMNMDMDVDVEMNLLSTPKISADFAADVAGLFGTPARPSTPTPKERPAAVFKTPTRPTPSHRPITRSVSKSIRTARSTAKSPGHALHQVQGTPTKTPRSSARQRNGDDTPHNRHLHAHFAADVDDGGLSGCMTAEFGTPFSSTLNQLLSEANDFTAGSSAHGLVEFDLPLDSDTGLSGHLEGLDFGHFLTTDAVMPSSPPILSRHGGAFVSADIDFEDAWEAFGDVNMDAAVEGESQ